MAAFRRLAPGSTSISFFSLTNLILGMEHGSAVSGLFLQAYVRFDTGMINPEPGDFQRCGCLEDSSVYPFSRSGYARHIPSPLKGGGLGRGGGATRRQTP